MRLEKMKQSDYPILSDLYQNKDVMQMITGYPLEEETIQQKWKDIMSWKKKFGYYKVLVDNECVGIGCLKPHQNDVEIGYMLFPKYWKRGYGTKICEQLVEIAQMMDVQKMVAYIDPYNQASKKILEKQGFLSVYIKGDTEILERNIV